MFKVSILSVLIYFSVFQVLVLVTIRHYWVLISGSLVHSNQTAWYYIQVGSKLHSLCE
jgi:hypothetical protein